MSASAVADRLSPDEVERYRDAGIVIPRYRLPSARIERLRSTLDRLIAENPTVRPERLVSAHIEGRNSEGVRGSRDFLALAREPGILDLVEQLIGPDIILWGCQIFCKPGGDGMEVPWHQDGHYWPIRPLATCTVWVALDPSTVANGCLRVIPGSHRGRRLYGHLREDRDDVVLNQAVKPGEFDPSAALDVELAPGQMSMHDVYLIHGSNPNRSPQRRAGVAIRYMPATSLFDRGLMATGAQSGYTVDFASRPIWLLRGVDRTGSNDFRIGHRPEMASA
jgi:ectoine hydroxylase-related dioxygenase (phytanoyl-CoA dioxygenase family)